MKGRKDEQFRDGDDDDARLDLFESALSESLDAWQARFDRLIERARQHGFAAVAVISATDPMTDFSAMVYAMRGSRFQNIGAMRSLLAQMEND